MKTFLHYIALLLFIGLINTTALSQKAYYSKDSADRYWEQAGPVVGEIDHTVYLIGDAGETDVSHPTALKMLGNHLKEETENSSVIFLGDNIYPRGMPPVDSPDRADAEINLNAQLDILKNYSGRIAFIPGNHDWDHWSEDGWEGVKREAEFVEAALNAGNTFIPDNGCPGPVQIPIGDEALLVIIDTQWWLHKHDKPYDSEDSCGVTSEFEFIEELQKIAQDNWYKQIILVGHHPLFTNGSHGSYFTVKDHLFPLTVINKNLLIPLPGLGSIYPIYRKNFPPLQDVKHDRYQLLKSELLKAFEGHQNFIYAAGHEHSLQYFEVDNQHFIVSGAGSKTTHVMKRRGANFNIAKTGFSKVIYLKSGETWMEFWTTSENNEEAGELVYRKKIKEARIEFVDANVTDYRDSTIMIAAYEDFKAGKFKSFWLGAHHRNLWTVPVEVNVLDLGTQDGGLTPLKLGGGMQTKSLRLVNPEGTQFIFRSIMKDPAKQFLSEDLQKTWVRDLLTDQMSMAHPFGAFAVPSLAEGAGILHKDSKIVYIPDDPRLGEFRGVYKNTLALFEGRANKEIEDFANFGYAERAIGTPDLIALMHEDTENVVDETDMLKNRLFDMWIGDFDRHDDQWRWAEFECQKDEHDACYHVKDHSSGKGIAFRPVPRDRDQVFIKVDGAIPWLASRKFAPGRILRNFDYEIHDIIGLNVNGRELDRTFLSRLDRDKWISIATTLQSNLTDSVIESSFDSWPDTIYQMSAPIIIEKLKSRRDDMVNYALSYYDILSKQVEVVGSDKDEFFEVHRRLDGTTLVNVYKKHKHDSDPYYSRVFKMDETKEIHLYGLGGDDEFEIYGNVKKGITLRIIGGSGLDIINDISTVNGLKKHTLVFDDETGTVINGSKETKNKTSDVDSDVNDYSRARFKPDVVAPVVIVGFDVDNGVRLGGGISIKKHAWRKEPFSSTQRITAAYALKTQALRFTYQGNFYQALNKWDLHLDANIMAPANRSNYFGLGNETSAANFTEDYFRISFNRITTKAFIGKRIAKSQWFKFGPKYLYVDIEESTGDFVSSSAANLPNSAFKRSDFLGFEMNYELNTMDHKRLPRKGVKLTVTADILDNTTKRSTLSNFATEFSFAKTFKLPFSPTIAARFGGSTIVGDFEFYQANVLGSQNIEMERGNLRGFLRDRFSGRSVAYQNTDLRIQLFKIKSYLFPGTVGLLGFLDHGRVWADNETSSVWHQSYGGGAWMSIMETFVLVASYEQSVEGSFINIRTSFMF